MYTDTNSGIIYTDEMEVADMEALEFCFKLLPPNYTWNTEAMQPATFRMSECGHSLQRWDFKLQVLAMNSVYFEYEGEKITTNGQDVILFSNQGLRKCYRILESEGWKVFEFRVC